MAAAITLKSTTLEGQLFELLNQIQLKEALVTTNTTGANVRMSIDTDTFSISFSGTLFATLTVDNSGKALIEPKTYLT